MPVVRWSAIALAALLLVVSACASPAQPASPTRPPPPPPPAKAAATATPSPEPIDLGDDPGETVAVFLDQLSGVIDEASVMAEASCEDLKDAQTDNPTVFRSVRGYAATLKRLATQSPDLSQDPEVVALLAELDTTMGQLDGALSLCGISLS